jgi:hypothetical protein
MVKQSESTRSWNSISFFANKGYHPCINIKHEATSSQMAEQYAEDLGELHAYLREQVKIAIDKYARATRNRHIDSPEFKEGDKVWLNGQNIKSARPTKKLDQHFYGPFEIIKKISLHAYRLKFSKVFKSIHNVFHVSLLEPVTENPIPKR